MGKSTKGSNLSKGKNQSESKHDLQYEDLNELVEESPAEMSQAVGGFEPGKAEHPEWAELDGPQTNNSQMPGNNVPSFMHECGQLENLLNQAGQAENNNNPQEAAADYMGAARIYGALGSDRLADQYYREAAKDYDEAGQQYEAQAQPTQSWDGQGMAYGSGNATEAEKAATDYENAAMAFGMAKDKIDEDKELENAASAANLAGDNEKPGAQANICYQQAFSDAQQAGDSQLANSSYRHWQNAEAQVDTTAAISEKQMGKNSNLPDQEAVNDLTQAAEDYAKAAQHFSNAGETDREASAIDNAGQALWYKQANVDPTFAQGYQDAQQAIDDFAMAGQLGDRQALIDLGWASSDKFGMDSMYKAGQVQDLQDSIAAFSAASQSQPLTVSETQELQSEENQLEWEEGGPTAVQTIMSVVESVVPGSVLNAIDKGVNFVKNLVGDD